MIHSKDLGKVVVVTGFTLTLLGQPQMPSREIKLLRKDRIQGTSPKPLREVLNALEARYGLHFTYEDPAYEFPGDLVETTHPDYRKAHPNDRGAWDARWKPIQIDVDIPANTLKPDPEQVAQRLVDAHIIGGNPGMIRWRKVGDVIDIYPAMVRDAKGDLKAAGSILDAKVTIPPHERNCIQALMELLTEVSKANGRNVVLATVPFNALRQSSCTQGVSNETGRVALIRIFEDMNRWRTTNESDPLRITWQLLFQPVEKTYFFNAHSVTIQRPHPFFPDKTVPELVR